MPKILITSGPTRQYLDPIRYLTNASSGRMGAALAQAALDAGFEVVVVSGPVDVKYPDGAQVVDVVSTEEMRTAAMQLYPECVGAIGAAAPCDYRPDAVLTDKMSKNDFIRSPEANGELLLRLRETPDIMVRSARRSGNFRPTRRRRSANGSSRSRSKRPTITSAPFKNCSGNTATLSSSTTRLRSTGRLPTSKFWTRPAKRSRKFPAIKPTSRAV